MAIYESALTKTTYISYSCSQSLKPKTPLMKNSNIKTIVAKAWNPQSKGLNQPKSQMLNSPTKYETKLETQIFLAKISNTKLNNIRD